MTAPNAERYVRYTMTTFVDPAAKKTAMDFGAAFERMQKGITETEKIEAKKRADIEEKRRVAQQKANDKAIQQQQKLEDQKAAADKRAADKKAKEEERATAKRIKDEERAAKLEEKINAQKARDAERTAQAKIRAEERAAAAIERENLRIARINFRANEIAKQQTEAAANARIAAEQRIRREHEITAKLSQEYSRRMTDGFLKAGEGVATLGRGIVALGIAGEEDLEKLVRTFARVQGIVDLTKGGIETYRGLREGVAAYKAMVDAAAKSEFTLAMIRRMSAGTMPRGAGWGAAGLGGLMRGGIALGGAGAIGVVGAGAAAILGVGAAGAMALNIGGVRDWATSGRDKITGDERFFGMDPTPNGGLGYGIGSLGVPFEYLGGGGNLSALAGEQRNAIAAQKRTASMKSAQDQRRWMEENERIRLQEEYEFERQRYESRSGRDDLLSQIAGANPDAIMNRAQSAMAYATQQQSELSRMRAGNVEGQMQQFSEAQVSVQEQRTLQAINDAVRLRRESLEIAKQTNREERDAAEETIRKLDTQIEKQRRLQKESEDRLLSARERFGQLDAGEQARLIRIKQKADASGFAALTREERAALRSVGTEGAESLARQGDLASANAAGFDKYFGGTERQQIKDSIAEQAKLEAEVKVQREVVVKLEADDQKIIDTVVEQVSLLLEQKETTTDEKMRRALVDLQAARNSNPKNFLPAGT